MKRKVLLLIASLLLGVCAHAADGDVFTGMTSEGVEMTFVVVSESGFTVKVGDGTNAAIATDSSGNLTIPASVEHGDEIYNVVAISANAFSGCAGITVVTIPSDVTSIGANAFNECNGMTSVNIPEGVTAIADATFKGCTSLTEVTIPSGVKTIGINAFNRCSSLTSVSLPESLTSLGNYAFYSCSSLPGITIPESVATIGIYAFAECKALASANIPSSLKTIQDYQFYNTALTSIEIPAGVQYVNKSSFRGCSKLTQVYARMQSPRKFGGSAFGGISSNCGLHVPEGRKDAYIAAGWTSAIFKGGVVEGDDTPTLGFRITQTTEEGVQVSY